MLYHVSLKMVDSVTISGTVTLTKSDEMNLRSTSLLDL
jgi:hypothetical protein